MARNGVEIFVRPVRYQHVVSLKVRPGFWWSSYHRALPSAKADLGCSTLSVKCGFSMIGILLLRWLLRASINLRNVAELRSFVPQLTQAPLYLHWI
jgi:hypothetical protein